MQSYTQMLLQKTLYLYVHEPYWAIPHLDITVENVIVVYMVLVVFVVQKRVWHKLVITSGLK